MEKTLTGIFGLVAAVTRPEMALEPEEAHAWAEAFAEVQRCYPDMLPISEGHLAIGGLAMVSAQIVGKRALILMAPPAPARPAAAPAAGANGAAPAAPAAPQPDPASWWPPGGGPVQ